MVVSVPRFNWQHLLAAIICCCCVISRAGTPPTVVLSAPTTQVVAGTSVAFWVNAMNTSSDKMRWMFPSQIECRVTSSDFSERLTANLGTSAQPMTVEIAPGAFVRREYALQFPQSLSGEVTVEMTEVGQGRLVFQVRAAATHLPSTNAGVLPFLKGHKQTGETPAYSPEEFFKAHIFGYEPFYFIAGPDSPNAKFQISFEYRLLNEYGRLAQKAPWLAGFYLAYSQTSLWDWNAPSAPFFDSSYRPEFFYSRRNILGGKPDNWFRLNLQGGVQHESNGRAGLASRSMNIAYLRPTMVFGRENGLQLSLTPRVWTYVGGLGDNPDMPDYRGYADLRATLGWTHGVQVSMLGRIGQDGEHPGGEFNLTYPLMRPPYRQPERLSPGPILHWIRRKPAGIRSTVRHIPGGDIPLSLREARKSQ